MINLQLRKHNCHSKGCPNSHINTQCTSFWRPCRHVFSHANGHKGAECHLVIDCPKRLASVVAIRQWSWQALEKVPASTCPIHVQLARNLGILLARTVVHHEEHVVSQQLYVDIYCPAEKAHHLPVEEMQYHGVNNLCNVASTLLCLCVMG